MFFYFANPRSIIEEKYRFQNLKYLHLTPSFQRRISRTQLTPVLFQPSQALWIELVLFWSRWITIGVCQRLELSIGCSTALSSNFKETFVVFVGNGGLACFSSFIVSSVLNTSLTFLMTQTLPVVLLHCRRKLQGTWASTLYFILGLVQFHSLNWWSWLSLLQNFFSLDPTITSRLIFYAVTIFAPSWRTRNNRLFLFFHNSAWASAKNCRVSHNAKRAITLKSANSKFRNEK